MRPKSKSESRWKYWREENRKKNIDKFQKWAKKMMKRARRRFLNDPNNFN